MSYADLIVSEYVEGSSNNKAIELFNGTTAPINLASAGYVLQVYFNGATTAGLNVALTGTVAAGDVFVLAHAAASVAILSLADQTSNASWFNGNDAIVLRRGGETGSIVDVIGQIGTNPGTEWGTGLVSTSDNTLRRKDTFTAGDTIGSDPFDPAVQWTGFPEDSVGDLGRYTPATASTAPVVTVLATDATAREAGEDPASFRISRTGATTGPLAIDFAWTFSGASQADFRTLLATSVTIPGGQSFVDVTVVPLDDAIAEGSESLTLQLNDAAAYDLGAASAATAIVVDNDGATTRISTVQGSAGTSPLVGQIVTVQAVVVGDFQVGGFNGFYLQEEGVDQDGNPATSEGLFVHEGSSRVEVRPGDVVRITGTVAELASGTSSLTELTDISAVVVSTGGALPSPARLSFPVASAEVLEAHEGMLVATNALVVTDTSGLGQFGEVLLSSGGSGDQPGTDARLDAYTQFNLPSASGFATYQDGLALRRLVLDDGTNDNFPPSLGGLDGKPLSADNGLRGGARLDSGVVGILDDRYGSAEFGPYRLQPTEPVRFLDPSGRPAPPELYGVVRVASFNIENFFNGDGAGGGFPTPRGADDTAEYQRQRAKVVQGIQGLDADVVGLVELENDGYGSASAIQDLVRALNELAGPGSYAFVDPGRPLLGSDQITVGFIYRPGMVRTHGVAAVLDSQFTDPDGGGFNSAVQRPSLAQTFEVVSSGALFTPVVNHLKSKASSAGGIGDADANDGQGLSNGTRTRAADTLVDWLATDPTGSGNRDFLVLGDLNAYAMEDPVRTIRAGADNRAGTADDFTDLLAPGAYSYAFAGEWGAFDHALASASLGGQITGAAIWHINADEPEVLGYDMANKSADQRDALYAADPFRSSDHDPVVVALAPGFASRSFGTAGADQLVGTLQGDFLAGAGGSDVMEGKSGNDHIDGGPGVDVAVFGNSRGSAVLGRSAVGVTAITAVDGSDVLVDVERLRFSDVSVAFDLDGNAGIVARILGAVFGAESVGNEVYAGIGLQYLEGGGLGYAALCDLAIRARLAGDVRHEAVVELLWSNVVRQPLPAGDRGHFVGLLDSGQLSIGELGQLAAETEINAVNIDLVGLAHSGLEYQPIAFG